MLFFVQLVVNCWNISTSSCPYMIGLYLSLVDQPVQCIRLVTLNLDSFVAEDIVVVAVSATKRLIEQFAVL